MVFFLGVILFAEGFLVGSLLLRSSAIDFLAAVVGSEIVSLTNEERAALGEGDLTENAQLQLAAQRKADDMALRGYFSHNGPDGKQPWAWIAEAGYEYHYAGENLAVRFVDSGDVVRAWMKSPTHRDNIVRDEYEEIGVGIAQGMYNGSSVTFVVQMFGTPRAVASLPPAPVPSLPAPAVAGETTEEEVSVAEPVVAPAQPALDPAEVVATGLSPQASVGNTFLKALTRALSDPRSTTSLVLGGVAATLLAAVAMTFFIHIQVQPMDQLAKGTMVAAFAIALIVVNARGLDNLAFENQSASVVGSTGGVIIGEEGVHTERFFIEAPAGL